MYCDSNVTPAVYLSANFVDIMKQLNNESYLIVLGSIVWLLIFVNTCIIIVSVVHVVKLYTIHFQQ